MNYENVSNIKYFRIISPRCTWDRKDGGEDWGEGGSRYGIVLTRWGNITKSKLEMASGCRERPPQLSISETIMRIGKPVVGLFSLENGLIEVFGGS